MDRRAGPIPFVRPRGFLWGEGSSNLASEALGELLLAALGPEGARGFPDALTRPATDRAALIALMRPGAEANGWATY